MLLKSIWRKGRLLLAKLIAYLVYDSKYLKSKYFLESEEGWFWVLNNWFYQTILFHNKGVPWPVTPSSTVANYRNIQFDPNDLHIFQTKGTYFQAIDGKIIIGKGTWIAPNVGIITTNHDLANIDSHLPGKDIEIGEKNWIGMNSMILPGVSLGPNTVVAAGAVVTKSFKEGNCILAGVPAKVIKRL